MVEQAVFNGDKKKLVSAALRVRNACKFPANKFTPVSLKYAAENQLNLTSSSGFPYFRRKGIVLNELIEQAEYAIQNPKSMIWFWPCVRGFRIQIRETLNELSRKIRLMYPYPGFLILIEDMFIMPFVSHFINSDTFYVIGCNGQEIGRRLKSRFESSNKICSLDISSFDQSLVNEAIILAFWIIRSQLRLTVEQSFAFENMVSYFCSQIMVSKGEKGAYAFIKHHGVPSGSGFTNMIDTIAHAIVIEYLHPGLLQEERTLICGDDNIFDYQNVDIKQFFVGYKHHFNLTVDVKKTDFYKTANKVKFLGFEFINYERYVSPRLVINQMLWHTDFITYLSPYERELGRSASILLNGKNGADLFTKLFPDVIQRLKAGNDVRFTYLVGYSPPTSKFNPSVVGRTPKINFSLIEQMRSGYLTR